MMLQGWKPAGNDSFGNDESGGLLRLAGRAVRLGLLLLTVAALNACSVDHGANVLSDSGTVPVNPDEVRSQLARYTMPSELSAVPVSSGAESPSGMEAADGIPHDAADPGTDYATAVTRTYVEENTLEQFAMLEEILRAIDQTEYEKEIGNGPYRAMVAVEEKNEGRTQKKLENWLVQSEAVTDGEQPYLLVQAWIEKISESATPVIKAEFRIYSPPVLNTDGTYQDYGVWDMNVKLDEIGDEDYFVADCRPAQNGFAKIRLYQKLSGMGQIGEEGLDVKTKAVMYRSASRGYGKIYYPDYDAYFCPDCDQSGGVPHRTAVYAYNDGYLAVQEGQDGEVEYRDRNHMVMMTHRYGVYQAESGDDVLKTKSFGFPIRYTEEGVEKHAYYGVWRGRHEIWTHDGSPVSMGIVVSREDLPPNRPAEEYTVGRSFGGVLVKRTYQEADLIDIQNIPAEVMINQNYNLFYNDGAWEYCSRMDWAADPPVCASGKFEDFDATVGLNTLVGGATGSGKAVSIRGWDWQTMEEKIYVYEEAAAVNGGKAGFYEAEEIQGDSGIIAQPFFPRVPIDTDSVDRLWVDIWGRIFIEYKGAAVGWVEKQLDYFDEFTWTPKFVEGADRAFLFPEGLEVYMDMQGTAYVVRKSAGVITVKNEIQTACNPVNLASVLPEGNTTVFYDQWNPDANSTYRFVTDPTHPDYMMLVYDRIGDNDIDANGVPLAAKGDIAPALWGIEAVIGGESVSFNWEYDASGAGGVTYLMEGNDYKLLDDPLRFDDIALTNGAGQARTLSLGYDGWMMGLPDLYEELEKSGWVVTRAIRDKIINLPAGTLLTETTTGAVYVVKPLERSLFLLSVDDPGGLEMDESWAISLTDIPIYTEHGMGDMPVVETVSYSEGRPVE
ncbi:MAG: hypothetical protein ACOZF0_22610 [Thermodesulfobacteriota bacterium]